MIVAVKILKDDIEYRPTFDQEIQLLKKLQDHANVIKLIGVISEPSYCCTVTELMRQDLLNYLQEWPEGSNDTVEQLDRSLVTFALHVTRAMEYLKHQQVVHRDIAARNILISFDDVAKIADFGLSRDVYQKGQYQRHPTGGMLVPVRWMAPEALSAGVYSHESDIWSYGVLLWEMATRGDTPYPEFRSLEPAFLVQKLTMGHRMSKPRHCTEDIYGLMRHCWNNNPEERISPSGLVNNISRFEKFNKGMFFKAGQ
ncbi:fibroblast growth factor receptor 3-like [Ptychodera flava]|uniref:fibroblast growth factor receptor 3-like n=1 Tax=Ptychodera flava TaxID=63121 RepID=UPI00396A10D5